MDIQSPPPVNLAFLKGILEKSKSVMQATDAKNPITLSQTTQAIVNEEVKYEAMTPQVTQQPQNYSADYIQKSNLPEAVKRAMIDKPIPQLQGLPQKFTLEDMYNEGDEKEMPLLVPKKTAINKQVIQENRTPQNNGDMITISRATLDAMINEKVLSFFKTSYDKTLTEQTIKRTISTLIKEGVIAPNKKRI